MENMRDIQEERKRIRQQLDTAYNQKNREKMIEAAKELSLIVKKIINN